MMLFQLKIYTLPGKEIGNPGEGVKGSLQTWQEGGGCAWGGGTEIKI